MLVCRATCDACAIAAHRSAMCAHAGERGRGAAERRKRAEGTRRGRAARPARTREPGALAAVDTRGGGRTRARAETPCTWTLCAWFVRCLQLRAPSGSLLSPFGLSYFLIFYFSLKMGARWILFTKPGSRPPDHFEFCRSILKFKFLSNTWTVSTESYSRAVSDGR